MIAAHLDLSPDRQSLTGIVDTAIPAGAQLTIKKIEGEYRLVVHEPEFASVPAQLSHIPGLRVGSDSAFQKFKASFQKGAKCTR
jgi:hypothetical protein